MQHRRLLMRLSPTSGGYRERLLDAMALLLSNLHRTGVCWSDCSLANTLFRRDGDRLPAYLVDAETSGVHPTMVDGQRRYDLGFASDLDVGPAAPDARARLRTSVTTRRSTPRASARRAGRARPPGLAG